MLGFRDTAQHPIVGMRVRIRAGRTAHYSADSKVWPRSTQMQEAYEYVCIFTFGCCILLRIYLTDSL
jgi:hypothetical protein